MGEDGVGLDGGEAVPPSLHAAAGESVCHPATLFCGGEERAGY